MNNIINLIVSFCGCGTYFHNDKIINGETQINDNVYELDYDNTQNNTQNNKQKNLDNEYYLYDDKTNDINKINIRDKKILIIDNFI